MRHHLGLLAAALLVAAASTFAMAQTFSALRGSTPLDQEGPAAAHDAGDEHVGA